MYKFTTLIFFLFLVGTINAQNQAPSQDQVHQLKLLQSKVEALMKENKTLVKIQQSYFEHIDSLILENIEAESMSDVDLDAYTDQMRKWNTEQVELNRLLRKRMKEMVLLIDQLYSAKEED